MDTTTRITLRASTYSLPWGDLDCRKVCQLVSIGQLELFYWDNSNMTEESDVIGAGDFPDELYLPDPDFMATRPLNVGVGESDDAQPTREQISAEREVASIAHHLLAGPNGKMVVYLVKPKNLDLFINQARAVTAWHGPSTAALLIMNVDNQACIAASVSKQQMLWLPATEWIDSCAKLIGIKFEGDQRLALGMEGNASGLREAIPMLEAFGKKKLGLA